MLRIEIIPCLTDNYAYLIINDKNQAVLIDAPDAEPIAERINAQGLTLQAILITHHHSDHVQGLGDFSFGSNDVVVMAPRADSANLPHCDVWLKPGEKVKLAGMHFQALQAHGHTLGHLAYSLPEAKALFTADSLMFWGCGRLFEGTPEMMWETLEGFMKLPPDTNIYSGHNYGVANGNFALSLGGYLDRMNARLRKVEGLNAEGQPVVPASLQEEMDTNPFLLARDDEYAKALGIAEKSPLERFTHIRKLRDNF